jgi:hypothetical protein
MSRKQPCPCGDWSPDGPQRSGHPDGWCVPAPSPPAEPAPSLVEQIEAIVKRTEEVIAERSESPAETGHRQSVGYGRIRDLLRAAREAGGR